MNRSTISRIERGHEEPLEGTKTRLADALGAGVDLIFPSRPRPVDRSATPGAERAGARTFEGFAADARARGLTSGAELLGAFLALPREAQDALFDDLGERIDRERRESGEVA